MLLDTGYDDLPFMQDKDGERENKAEKTLVPENDMVLGNLQKTGTKAFAGVPQVDR